VTRARVLTPVEIDARAVELLGGHPGVVEFARSTARAALAERGPASERALEAVNRVLRDYARGGDADVARTAADPARPPLGLVDLDTTSPT